MGGQKNESGPLKKGYAVCATGMFSRQQFFTFHDSKKVISQEVQICSINLPAACVPRATKENSTRITRASVIASFSHNNTVILKFKQVRR